MPFELMDQRGLSASSHLFEDVRFPSERNGLWKPKDMRDLSGTDLVGASSRSRAIRDTSSPVAHTVLQSVQMSPPEELTAEQFLGEEESFKNSFEVPNNSSHQHLKPWPKVMTPPTSSSYGLGGTKIITDAGSHESSLFSSSLSEIFTSKTRLSGNDVVYHRPAHKVVSNNDEVSCGYHRENETELIGNLLPDENDLFSGVIDDFGYNADANKGTDLDDFDLFSSGGGLELEEEDFQALSDSKIAGRQIKLEPCGLEDSITCLMQQPHRGNDGHNIGHNFPSMHQVATSAANAPYFDTGHQHLYSSTEQTPSNYTGSPLAYGNKNGSMANTLSTPVGRSSAKQLVGFVDGVKAASVPRFHAHSLPEYHDAVANDIFCNSPNNTMDFAGNLGSRLADGIDGTRLIPNAESFGNCNYPPQGLHYMRSKSNLHLQHPNLMLWQNSPPFVNGACAPYLSQMSGYPRVPLHMVRPLHLDHHVGSAPLVNGSPWDRRLNHLGGSPEASNFHLGSLGNAGFPGPWQWNPANIPPQNMFSHAGGNRMDMTANAGQSSSKQICFLGKNPVMSMSKHDAASERSRNMYNRRGDWNTSNADKKQFELDIERIVRGEDNRTTLMIKNIPNKYTSKMLLAAIDEQCWGTYDFVYLPIDFKNKCNVGYAFINLIDPSQILPFDQAFSGKKWEKFNSEKVASLAYARIQGKAALIAHFQNSSLMNEDTRCRPILFHTDGPNAGDPEPFPIGTNIRSRPGKYRSSDNDEHRSSVTPSTTTGGEKSSLASD